MTYSHNSVGNNNLKMTTATATTKAARATGGSVIVANGLGGKQQFINRRTPPITTSVVNNFNNNNNDALHSNSIACSTNMQQHPLMSCSPSNVPEVVTTPTSGSYFGNQRKQQQQQQQQQRNTQWPSPTNNENSGMDGGGGAFFHKNNYAGQYFANHSRRKQQQRDEHQHRTPHGTHHSPATVLGGGINSDSSEKTAVSTGRKRRPKSNFQSPIISAPASLGVGGNISPTHPLLPAVLTHFAGSKCFDAPAPSAVPKPPQHWMQSDGGFKAVKSRSAAAIMGGGSSNMANCGRDMHTLAGHVVKSSKRNLLDDFDTHNLKLLLNVQS